MNCPLCGGPGASQFTTTDRNRGIGHRSFSYERCAACSTVFLSDPPEDLGPFYPPEYHQLPPRSALDAAAPGEAPRLDMIARYAAAGTLADIGAGDGVFARAALQRGFQVTGIDRSPRSTRHLEEVAEVRAICTDSPGAALDQIGEVSVVTLWHVLEHLPAPWEVLERAAQRLASGGVLAIATPNPEALQFRLLRGRWTHIDAPRHLFLIPAATLTARAQQAGLERVLLTTGDPAGRHWNRFGWEQALLRQPAHRAPTRRSAMLSAGLELLLRPLEARKLHGATYTALFVKRAAGG